MNRKVLYLSIIIFGISITLQAQISPGKLALPHAKLAGMSNCTKCHTLGGGPEDTKCLDCHHEIRQFKNNKTGFHFFVTERENKNCFECHSEHNGRNFSLIFWPQGKEKFDHVRTGYVLEGKHSNLKCQQCHQPGKIDNDPRKLNKEIDISKTFLGLGRTCLSCHSDEHQGQLAQDCLKCHNYSGWKPAVKFSHDRLNFRLIGKHQKVDCVNCHPAVPIIQSRQKDSKKRTFVKFKNLQFKNCTPCHKDPHLGKFGQNCQKCHDTLGWNRLISTGFNHSLTRFPLIGLHKNIACEKCHVGGKVNSGPRFEKCSYCHKDAHSGQFSARPDKGRCESCHDVFGFKPAHYDVSEHAKSDYPLTGAHLAIPCIACHVLENRGTSRERRKFEFANKRCSGCHEDIHKGQLAAHVQTGGCESCHQTSSWRSSSFDHNASRFPLLGKHTNVACRKCHKTVDVGLSSERILFRPMDMACGSCHKDIHFGQFLLSRPAKNCDKCHLPAGWEILRFNHDRDASLKLTGGHEKVSCVDCHKVETNGRARFVRYKPMDKRCVSCHANKR